MITQTHTLNPSINNPAAVSDLSAYLCSVQVREVFSDKGFVSFRDLLVCATSVRYSVFVPILNAFMQKICSSASNIFGGLSKVELIRGRFMEYILVDKMLDRTFHTSFRGRILYVFSLGSLLQVMWVAAFRVIANMHKHLTLPDRSVVIQGECNPVSQKLVLSPVSIAHILGSRFPFPTNIGIFFERNLDVLPKIMVVMKSGYRIVNNIFKRVHMKPIYQPFGTSQPCYGGKV